MIWKRPLMLKFCSLADVLTVMYSARVLLIVKRQSVWTPTTQGCRAPPGRPLAPNSITRLTHSEVNTLALFNKDFNYFNKQVKKITGQTLYYIKWQVDHNWCLCLYTQGSLAVWHLRWLKLWSLNLRIRTKMTCMITTLLITSNLMMRAIKGTLRHLEEGPEQGMLDPTPCLASRDSFTRPVKMNACLLIRNH